MALLLRYPSKVQNIDGNTIPYKSCDYIENITNDSNSVGVWGYSDPGSKYSNAISGVNGSRNHPSTIRGYDFQFAGLISENARINKITVQYSYRKLSYSSQTAHGSFGNPVITLPTLNLRSNGNAPPRNNFGEYEVTFDNLNLKGRDIITSDFGVTFDLPPNTSSNPCYIEIRYLRVVIDYTSGNYVPSISINPQELKYGEEATVTFLLNETTGTRPSESVSANFSIPNGLTIIDFPDSFDFVHNVWNAVTNNYRAEATFKVKLNSPSTGLFTFSLTENTTNHSASNSFYATAPRIEVWDFFVNNKEIELSTSSKTNVTTLHITIFNESQSEISLVLDFDGLKVLGNVPGLEGNILTVTDYQEGGVFDLLIQLYGEEDGQYQITMTSPDFYGVYSANVTVNIPDTLEGYYTVLRLNDFALSQLDHGETYVFGCLCRTTGASRIINGLKNLRASVTNNETEIFTNKLSQIGDWEWLTCEFTYDAATPIYLTFYGNYLEYDTGEIEFGNLFLIHSDVYAGYEYPVLALAPTTYLLGDFNGSANLMLEPPDMSLSTKHFFDSFDYQGLLDSNVIIHGIEVTGEVSTEEPINLILGFGNANIDEQDYYVDSQNITSDMKTFSFGGKFQTFGISFPDILGLMNDFRFFLQIDDAFDNITPFQVNMKNIQLTIYYSRNSEGDCDFFINGVSSKHYLISMDPETEIPRGANYDAQTMEIEGSDGEYPTRINIENKEIKLKFKVYGDDFEESTEILKYASDFLYPARDSLDNPILKAISFFFAPDIVFDYYIEDSIDASAEVGGYDCEVGLIIPSGLSRTIEPLHKSFAGDTTCIGKIKPTVIFKKFMEKDVSQIQVIEQESGRILKLEGEFINNLPDGMEMKIDSQERKVYYKQYEEWFQIDNNCITIDSEFFVINGYFSFENSINCKVTDVIFDELGG